MGNWYIEEGPESDVVISSRIRLARNLKDYPFPIRMSKDHQLAVLNKVKDGVLNSSEWASGAFLFLDMSTLNPIDKLALVEKHLISPDLAESERNAGALISRDEAISIMINEEDHLRIQCMQSGFRLEGAMELSKKLDSLLEEVVSIAYSKDYGYLTCCPTNVGTGLRASVMLHLPALTMTGYINNILTACNKLGLTVRGMFGENSEAAGSIYQVSNQVTLGLDEQEILLNVANMTKQIIDSERSIRTELYTQNPNRFEDRIYRSYGVFSNARVLTSNESLRLISDIRLGVEMGILKDIGLEIINELMLLIQPASLQKLAGKPLGAEERDIRRAEAVRERLGKS